MDHTKIYDVAGAAGVSLATVSRVLNHPEMVKPKTRQKVERIIKEMGYHPNLNAKGLASSRSTTVAIVVPELSRSSIAEMLNGIADCAMERGYLLRLFVNSNRHDMEPLELEKEVFATVNATGVDGVLYINDEMTTAHIDLLKSLYKDVVLTNTICSDPSIPSVAIDYEKAGYEITSEMIKRGNKKIWMITPIRKYAVNDLKIEGYTRAMKEAGLMPHIMPVSGKTLVHEITYEEALSQEYPEVAIVVRDSMAVSLINVARKLKIRVPDDLQVIGFQNTRYCVLSRPKLTCIDTPIYAIGEKAMDLLTKLMEKTFDPNKDELHPLVDYNIIWRESTKQNEDEE